MRKQMNFRKEKWALKRINGRYDSFVIVSLQVISYPSVGLLVSSDKSQFSLVLKLPRRGFKTVEFFWEALLLGR